MNPGHPQSACYRVLEACGDPRAGATLCEAHRLLITRAGFLADEAGRTTFLGCVPAHREIVALWERAHRRHLRVNGDANDISIISTVLGITPFRAAG